MSSTITMSLTCKKCGGSFVGPVTRPDEGTPDDQIMQTAMGPLVPVDLDDFLHVCDEG